MASQVPQSEAGEAEQPRAGDSFVGDVMSIACAHEQQPLEARRFDEARLFDRVVRGDRAAIDEVWHANRRWIAAVLAAHAPRGEDVEDLLQEVAATLVAKHHQLRDTASLRGWLRTVAINAARMAVRGRSVERRTLRNAAHGAARLRCEQASAARGVAEETLALLARIPAIYSEPLLLQSTQGLTQRQIAALLEVPETTVETRLARARRMLRQLAAGAECGARRVTTEDDRRREHHER